MQLVQDVAGLQILVVSCRTDISLFLLLAWGGGRCLPGSSLRGPLCREFAHLAHMSPFKRAPWLGRAHPARPPLDELKVNSLQPESAASPKAVPSVWTRGARSPGGLHALPTACAREGPPGLEGNHHKPGEQEPDALRGFSDSPRRRHRGPVLESHSRAGPGSPSTFRNIVRKWHKKPS